MHVKSLQTYSHACAGGNLILNSVFYISQSAMVICITQFAAEITVVVWRSILFLTPSNMRCTVSILNSLSNFLCTVFMHTSWFCIIHISSPSVPRHSTKKHSMRKIIHVVKKIIIN